MTLAQTAFLVALTLILAGVALAGVAIVARSRRGAGVGAATVIARLGRPSVARLELHRWAFYAHRISGLAILGFLALHVVDVGLVAIAPALYDEVHHLYGTPAMRVFEVALLAGILFHTCNGLRLLALDLVDAGARTSERLLIAAAFATILLTIPVAAIILRPVLG
jgi:succinate dehydrogenase / fumarate reductase cytochrome b subunit